MNNPNISKIGSFYFPSYCKTMPEYLISRTEEPAQISKYCKNKRTMLQAGGNIGAYPIWFSKIFNQVITFEPEPLNYECLLLNIKEHNINNITSYNAALGNENKNVSIRFDNNNCGGHNILIEEGNVKMMKIDDLELKELDLLMLDVEGQEIECLKSAEQTIKKFSPVICVEVAWCNPSQILLDLGYKQVDIIDVNAIFVKE